MSETKIYFACPTGIRRDNIVQKYGSLFGACLTRDTFNNVTASKMRYFLDNGCFKDFQDKVEPTLKNYYIKREKFLKRLEDVRIKVSKGLINTPDFVVVPDRVGSEDSLMVSRNWIHTFKEEYPEFKYYLAVQDGMRFYHKEEGTSSPYCVEVALRSGLYDGCFIGGTKKWKYANSEAIVKLSHKYNKPVHIGGIGTRRTILWAKSIGADSVDSGVAMLNPIHLKPVLEIHNDMFWNIA